MSDNSQPATPRPPVFIDHTDDCTPMGKYFHPGDGGGDILFAATFTMNFTGVQPKYKEFSGVRPLSEIPWRVFGAACDIDPRIAVYASEISSASRATESVVEAVEPAPSHNGKPEVIYALRTKDGAWIQCDGDGENFVQHCSVQVFSNRDQAFAGRYRADWEDGMDHIQIVPMIPGVPLNEDALEATAV